jgi:hypothetical protein
MFTLRRTRRYEFPVGQEERHDVVIEKSRRGAWGIQGSDVPNPRRWGDGGYLLRKCDR